MKKWWKIGKKKMKRKMKKKDEKGWKKMKKRQINPIKMKSRWNQWMNKELGGEEWERYEILEFKKWTD